MHYESKSHTGRYFFPKRVNIMVIEEFIISKQIESARQRTRTLCERVMGAPDTQADVTIDCLEELQNSLEELRIVEEELRAQNSELLLAHHLLEQERQRYADLFEFAPDAYLVTDCNGRIQEANRAAVNLFKAEWTNFLVGDILTNFVHMGQRGIFRLLLLKLPELKRVQEWEVKIRQRSQPSETVLVDVALTAEVVHDHTGAVIGFRWLLRDVTSRKQVERQLHQAERQNLELQESDRLKSQFIATVSHELRTPMNAILGFSQVLMRRCQDKQDLNMFNMVDRIFRNSTHLMMLIEELLDFSRLRSNKLQLRLESFDLASLIHNTVENLRSLADQKMLTLRIQLPDQPLILTNDPARLRQILINLLSNSIKFTQVGGITVKVECLPEDRLQVSVSDTGIGVAEDELDHLFREFWQSDQTLNRQQGGTGLGLPISKALVELMQGSISMESKLGEGSTFRVEIPQRLNLPKI